MKDCTCLYCGKSGAAQISWTFFETVSNFFSSRTHIFFPPPKKHVKNAVDSFTRRHNG